MATKRSATVAAATDVAPATAEFYRIAGETDAAGVAVDFAQVIARRAGPAPSMFCTKSSMHSRIVILLVIAAET